MQVLLTLQHYYVRRFFKYQMKFLVINHNAENTANRSDFANDIAIRIHLC